MMKKGTKKNLYTFFMKKKLLVVTEQMIVFSHVKQSYI